MGKSEFLDISCGYEPRKNVWRMNFCYSKVYVCTSLFQLLFSKSLLKIPIIIHSVFLYVIYIFRHFDPRRHPPVPRFGSMHVFTGVFRNDCYINKFNDLLENLRDIGMFFLFSLPNVDSL